MEDFETQKEEYDNIVQEDTTPTTGGEAFPFEEEIIITKIS